MGLQLIQRNTSESSLVSIPIYTLYILHMVQTNKVKEEMIDDQCLPVLQSIVYENEEDKNIALKDLQLNITLNIN